MRGQRPDVTSGVFRDLIPPLLYAAAAAGADGFFLETHPDPDHAPSDGPSMIPLNQLAAIVTLALDVWHTARAGGTAAARSQGEGGAVVEDRGRAVPPAPPPAPKETCSTV